MNTTSPNPAHVLWNDNTSLNSCLNCKMIYDCERKHEDHTGVHERSCLDVRKAFEKMHSEEHRLRLLGGSQSNANVFETYAGRFCSLQATRRFMSAKLGLVEKLLAMQEDIADIEARKQLLDLHHLCHCDALTNRRITPHVMLRLGQDQEAWNFCKWYAGPGADPNLNVNDLNLPFLHYKDIDMLESPEMSDDECVALSHMTAETLIKLRLLFSLEEEMHRFEDSVKYFSAMPPEIIDSVRLAMLPDTLVAQLHPKYLHKPSKLLRPLRKQIHQLLRAVLKHNQHIIPMMFHPRQHLETNPEFIAPGSLDEARDVLRWSYRAWDRTPGAIDFLEQWYLSRQHEHFILQ